ncbi:MAG: ATP synthase F1 subunit epsilon [Prevotella sp.]|nr:ATP synthase F1 subunit epsilon [Prevotella sp.]MBR7054552.1 ATP synthase F1 subunit epsilon [Prevotella sp.]
MLRLRIVSPESIAYDGEVESVKVPGILGNFEILNNHAPIISALQKGVVEYDNAEGRHRLEINGGFVEVQKNKVSLCVEVL